MQELRAICAGKPIVIGIDGIAVYEQAEVAICGFKWPEETAEGWFDFECLMDAGHKNPKHGQGGMVRRVEQ